MNQEEVELAVFAWTAINQYSRGSERSVQAGEFRVGISDVGFCQEFTRRMIMQEPESDERTYQQAFLGTAIGDHVEAALAAADPELRRGIELSTTLDGDQGVYNVVGHTDLLGDDIVIDVKSVAELLDFTTTYRVLNELRQLPKPMTRPRLSRQTAQGRLSSTILG